MVYFVGYCQSQIVSEERLAWVKRGISGSCVCCKIVSMRESVWIVNFGCKVNQYEGQCIREALSRKGYALARNIHEATLVVVNGCAVTLRAEKKSIATALWAEKMGKDVILTGCAGQSLVYERKNLSGIRIVPQEEKLTFFGAEEHITYFFGHARGFVKLQDGCSFSCSYCYIPKLRGPARLRDENAIKNEIRSLSLRGYKEIVFTGICLGWGGQDIVSLAKFARAVGIHRVRLSSIEPCFVTPSIISAVKEGVLCPHLHIPFQSGSDSVLRRMNRRYSSTFYKRLVYQIRNEIPDVAISTDVMVGFPDETEEEFKETLEFLKEIAPMRIHVFPFSPRPGTKAGEISNNLSDAVKRKRVREVISLSQSLFNMYKERVKDNMLEVLVLGKEGEYWVGVSENYLKVKFKRKGNLMGEMVKVKGQEAGIFPV